MDRGDAGGRDAAEGPVGQDGSAAAGPGAEDDGEKPVLAALIFLFFALALSWGVATGLVEVWRRGGEGWASLLLPGLLLVGLIGVLVQITTRWAVRRRRADGSPTG